MIQFDEHIFQVGWNHQLVEFTCVFESYMSPTNPAHVWEDGVFFPPWDFPFHKSWDMWKFQCNILKRCEVRGFKVLSGSRIMQGSKRLFQHTPGTYPTPWTKTLWRNSFHLGIWGCLGYTPGVCFGILLRRVLGTQHFRRIKYHRNPKWWFQTFLLHFYVHPYMGKIPNVHSYFSDGLKPPTRINKVPLAATP